MYTIQFIKTSLKPEEDISKDETRHIGIFYLVVQLPTIYFPNEKSGEDSAIFSDSPMDGEIHSRQESISIATTREGLVAG